MQILVGMADIRTAKREGVLTCLGLGSCVGLCAYDPSAMVGGMAHVMLPQAFADKENVKPGKFADTAIEALLSQMEEAGAVRSRIVVAMAGGAQVFHLGAGISSKLDIGARTARAIEEQIRSFELRCVAQDVGGNLGRTVTLAADSGEVRVRSAIGGERVLCSLGG